MNVLIVHFRQCLFNVYIVSNLHLYLQKNSLIFVCVHTLSLARNNRLSVEGFDIDEINLIIDYIVTRRMFILSYYYYCMFCMYTVYL